MAPAADVNLPGSAVTQRLPIHAHHPSLSPAVWRTAHTHNLHFCIHSLLTHIQRPHLGIESNDYSRLSSPYTSSPSQRTFASVHLRNLDGMCAGLVEQEFKEGPLQQGVLQMCNITYPLLRDILEARGMQVHVVYVASDGQLKDNEQSFR